MEDKSNPIILLAHQFEIEKIADSNNDEERFEILSEYIEHLIHTDFNKLVSILYRIDVSEEKLRNALADNSENKSAGKIIAELLIEREKEKIKWREMFKKNDFKRPHRF